MPFIEELKRFMVGSSPLPALSQITTSLKAEPADSDEAQVSVIERPSLSRMRMADRVDYARPEATITVRAKHMSVARQMARVLHQHLNIRNQAGVGAYTVSISALSRSGSVATATSPSHEFVEGQTITIAGANEPEYNGTFQITYIDADRFSYPVSGTPATPATGTFTGSFAGTRYVDMEPTSEPFDAGPDTLGRARMRFSVRALKGPS